MATISEPSMSSWPGFGQQDGGDTSNTAAVVANNGAAYASPEKADDTSEYSDLVLETRPALRQLRDFFTSKPEIAECVEGLQLLFSTNHYEHDDTVPAPNLAQFPNLRSFVSESFRIQPWSANKEKLRAAWRVDMEAYLDLFRDASLTAHSLVDVGPQPLANLKSVTLHWTGPDTRYWEITPTCPIFLLARLETLRVSCVRVRLPSKRQAPGAEPLGVALAKYRGQTGLKSLDLIESIVAPEALLVVLAWPRALEHFSLLEPLHHSGEVMADDRFSADNADLVNAALTQQAGSLTRLELSVPVRRGGGRTVPAFLRLRLAELTNLSSLRLGPVINRTGLGCLATPACPPFLVEGPIPPRLTSVRLSDVWLLSHKELAAVLGSIQLKQIMANAAFRGQPLEVEMALSAGLRAAQWTSAAWADFFPALSRFAVESGFTDGRVSPSNKGTEAWSAGPHPSAIARRLRAVRTDVPHGIRPPYLASEPVPRETVLFDSSPDQPRPIDEGWNDGLNKWWYRMFLRKT